LFLLPALLLSQRPAEELTVAGAADLAPLEKSLRAAFERATGVRLILTLASSGMLARQIEQGAPYDVYLSANQKFVDDLARSGHIRQDSVRVYAHGRLGLWSRSGSIRTLQDLMRPEVLHVAIANPTHAPYGMAARDLLQSQGIWETVRRKLVYGENVRQAYEYAASGNADAAITSWTLLHDKQGILLPEGWHKPIRQAGGIVAATPRRDAAQRFLDFLGSEEGWRLLQQGGLFPPTPSDASDRKPPLTR
jgi:molybdate transport system substrate-binding protein